MVQGFNQSKKIKLTIDGSKVEETLQDYPVLINLTDSSGINNGDCSELFDEFTNDIYSLPNGDAATVTDWTVLYGAFNISSKNIHFDCTEGVTKHQVVIGTLDEDFRFMSNFHLYNLPAIDDWAEVGIQLRHKSSGYVYRICRTQDTSIKARRNDPAYELSGTYTTTVTDFELYISKVSSTIQVYYRAGTATNMTLLATWSSIPAYDGDWEIMILVEEISETPVMSGYFYDMTLQSWNNKLAIEYLGHESYEVPIDEDSFEGINGDPPNPDLWIPNINNNDVAEIQTNELYYALEGTTNNNIKAKIILEGDFDISIDSLTNAGFLNTNDLFQFTVKSTSEVTPALFFGGLGQSNSTAKLWGRVQSPGEVYYDTTYNTSSNYGTIRISRLGSNVTLRFKTGFSSWYTLLRGVEWCDHDVYISLGIYTSNPGDKSYVKLQNFKVHQAEGIRGIDSESPATKVVTAPAIQQCYCEIERWDYASRSAQIWAKVPQIAIGKDTVLNLYYDKEAESNNSYVGSIGSTPGMNVWSNDFSAVYHLGAFYGGLDIIKDSVWGGGQIVLQSSNVAYTHNDDVTPAGRCQYIHNATYLSTLDNSAVQLTGGHHIEILMHPDIISTRSNPLHKAYGGCYSFTLETSGVLNSFMGTSGSDTSPYSSISISENITGNWHLISRSIDMGSLAWKIFLDETIKSRTTYPLESIVAGSANMYIGKGYTTDDFEGRIRTVRLAKAVRSNAWVKFTYFNEFDQAMTYKKEHFNFEGSIKVKGTSAQRWAYLYRRDTGELVDKVLSGPDGNFNLIAPSDDYYFLIVLPDLEDDYNIIPYDKIKPTI